MKKNLIVLLVMLLTLASCSKKKNEEKLAEKQVNVTTVLAQESDYKPELSYAGSVLAFMESNLSPVLPGRVEKIYCKEGQSVHKGDLLAELQGEMLTQALIENMALKKDFERVTRLKDKGSISEMDFDHLKAKFEASEAKVQMLKKSTEIRAPFSGTVVAVNLHEGENYSILPSIDVQNMSIKTGIIRMVQINPIKIEIEVGEKDISSIKNGQTVNFTVDAYPEKTFEGKIKNIKSEFSQSSRTVKVEVESANSGSLLKPGMFAHVAIQLPVKKGILIPLKALYRMPGSSTDYVFVVQNNTAKMIKVERMQIVADNVVVNGLNVGDEVVVEGKNKLNDGTKVVVKNK